MFYIYRAFCHDNLMFVCLFIVESTFIKAGDSETKEGLRVEKATGESLGGALPGLSTNVVGKCEPRQGCC